MALDARITLQKLQILTLVVELGSVTQAAEQLFVAQPVVTAHIRSLEERIGARLFYREGRQMHLTEAGRAVHAWAEDILTRTRELGRHLEGLSDGSQGTVVLSTSMSIGSYSLPPVLTAFRERWPLVDIHVDIFDTEHAIEQTRSGAADFAVVVADAEPASAGLDAEQLGEDELVVVAPPDGPLGLHDEISVQQLAELPFIEAPAHIIRHKMTDRQLRKLGISKRRVVMHLGHPEAMKRAAEAGLGVSLLFRGAVARELALGDLREIRVTGVHFAVPVYLIYRKGKLFSPLHLELLKDIRQHYTAETAAALVAEGADAGS